MRRAHILTYHSGNIDGNDYATNDLVALAADLELLRRLDISVVPLRDLADAVIQRSFHAMPERAVALTLDDGLDFDFLPLTHPRHGPQRSVHEILRDFGTRHRVPVHATSFVIAGPVAREAIAQYEMEGLRWINDSWWPAAVASGYFHIGNHSWDHVSASVALAPGESARRTSSRFIDNAEAAHYQVRAARDYIESIVPNPGSALFAFPYGDYSRYLIEDYLPDERNHHGTVAAFTAEAAPVTEDSNRWVLPRYLCRHHWNSPDALAALLGGD